MPQFRFTALNVSGAVVSSSEDGALKHIEADSRENVLMVLHEKGLTPIRVTEIERGQWRKTWDFLSGGIELKWWVSLDELEMFCRIIAILIPAGVRLPQALELSVAETENKWFQKRLRTVTDDVRDGLALSEAMAKHPRVFSPLMVALVDAGQASGKLAESLEQLADIFHRNSELRRDVITAVTYPGFVLFFFTCLIVGIVLMTPKVVEDFVGRPLSYMHKGKMLVERFPAVIRGCYWVKLHPLVWLIPATTTLFPVLLMFLGKRYDACRSLLARAVHATPLLGKITQYFTLVRMLETFCMVQKAGVETKRALEVTRSSSGHVLISDALGNVIDRVTNRGMSRPGALAKEKIFPHLLVELWRVGEHSGDPTRILRQVALYFYSTAKAMTDRIVALIDPVIIISMGALIGPVLVALYQSMQVMRDLYTRGIM